MFYFPYGIGAYCALNRAPVFMQYDIKAKPTVYNGRLYRSRLEAKWAAFFDLTGWKFEYEPSEMCGRNPDFLLHCNSKAYSTNHILVEIKPAVFMTEEYVKDAVKAYDKLPAHLLFLTDTPFYKSTSNYGNLIIGKGSQYVRNAVHDEEPFRTHVDELAMKCENDFASTIFLFDSMIYNSKNRKDFLDIDRVQDAVPIITRWIKAGNQTMFMKP